jgi:hypothetical protein
MTVPPPAPHAAEPPVVPRRGLNGHPPHAGYGPPSSYGYAPHGPHAPGYGAPPPGYGYAHGAFVPPPGLDPLQARLAAPSPLPHPRAQLVVGLGLSAFLCLGPFTGIAAVLVGRQVLRDVRESPGRYAPAGGSVKLGIGLGAAGSVALGALVVTASALNSYALSGLAFAAGVAACAAWFLPVTRPQARRLDALAYAAVAGPLLLGGAVASLASFGNASRCEQEAAGAVGRLDAAAKGSASDTLKALLEADGAFEIAQSTCGRAGRSERVAALQGKRDELAVRRVQVEEGLKREKVEAQAADREAQAVASFPANAKKVAANLASAKGLMAKGGWASAGDELDAAQALLAEADGTSVGGTKEWRDLSGQVSALRTKLQPQLDKIAARERAAEEKLLQEEAIRGPEPGISGWSGECLVVRRFLKSNLRDPDSYDHIATTKPRAAGPFWVVTSRYRAKNGFGGYNAEQRTFYIAQGEVLKVEGGDLRYAPDREGAERSGGGPTHVVARKRGVSVSRAPPRPMQQQRRHLKKSC